MEIVPRTYQKTAVKAALDGLHSSKRRALVVLATGLGKTLTAAFVGKEFDTKPILFLVHNNFILAHAIDEFRLVFDQKTKIATYNGMSKEGADEADIVFSTWQTMGRNLKKWKHDHFKLVIVDEAHHSEANTYKPVLEYFRAPRLGITATPERQDEADIRSVFGPEVANVTLEEAIARGWLPRIEYHVVTDESLDNNALQKIASEIRNSKKRFTMAEVNRRIFIRKRDVEIGRIISGYNEKAVVFCASISHAERLAKSLELADTFHSQKGSSQNDNWNKNQAVLNHLKNGTIRQVCAVNAFNEGVNVPSVGLVAFCRVTGTPGVFRQQLGRGLRPGKEKLIVLDFVGNLERIQLVQTMMNRVSDLHEEYTPRDEIEKEGYVRQRFEVSGKGFEFTFSDNIVDLMEVFEHCQKDLYPTWQEASKAAVSLGIKNGQEYHRVFKQDDRLPASPHQVYPNFPGWEHFLQKEKYRTWKKACASARKLGFKSRKDYQTNWKKDPRLPSNPRQHYKDFPGWKVFIPGKRKSGYQRNRYKTLNQVKRAIQRLKITSGESYRKNYKKDPLLVRHPKRVYADFPGWEKFLADVKK